MTTFYKLRIEKIIRETSEAVTLCFAIPTDLKEKFVFIAGQYINLQITLNNETIRRSYSICSGPNDQTLNVTVKAVKKGVFSEFANIYLKEGALVEVSVPEGRFNLPTSSTNAKNYLGIAAGSGITPIMSMIKQVISNEPQSKFVLLFGNKSPDKTIFFNEIENLKNKYPEQFFVSYVFSEQSIQNSYEGRIDETIINNLIQNKHSGLIFDQIYLCGPEPLIDLAKKVLKANDFADTQIHFELFTSSLKENIVSSSSENCLAKVIVDNEIFEIDIQPGQTILEAVLKAGIDAPYSCQGGVCSTCLAKTSNGQSQMKKNTVLTDSEINSGLVLTCQAICKSTSITVDYDDI